MKRRYVYISMFRLWLFLILCLYLDICTARKIDCNATKSSARVAKEMARIKDKGMVPVRDSDLGFSLFVTVFNVGVSPISVMSKPVQCCEVLTSSITDCKTIKLMGGYMGTIQPGRFLNASWVYPTLYKYNRRGECVLELWWRDSYNRTDSTRFSIPFDTYFLNGEPLIMMSEEDKKLLMTKTCESPDLDVLDDCSPVDCHVKYDGHKNYFSWSELLCVPSPACYADPEKHIPDVGYSPIFNQCLDLESPIEEDDMSFLLRPSVKMDIYETMGKQKATQFHTMRCHHGVLDEDSRWCVCDRGWSSAPVPEDFSYQRTIFTHMCTIYDGESSYDYVYMLKEIWENETLYLGGVAMALAAMVVFLSCFLDCCCLQSCCLLPCCLPWEQEEEEEHIYEDICEDDDNSEVLLESDATEICSLSSENQSDDVSDFHFTESSSGNSSDGDSRRVTWRGSNKNSWRLNRSQNIDVLYPAKLGLKSQGSTGADSKSSSKGSASSSTDREKMFEMHFRLLVSLLLRKQPSTDAREHLDWIFKNCPGYQKRIVIRFMKSFGMDVDENGNIRGFRRKGSKIWKKNKTRSCHLRPKRLDRGYRYRREKSWEKPECALPLGEGCREEPEGSSDIDRSLTISPDYGDILKFVLPICLGTSPIPDTETEPKDESDPEEEEQEQLLKCSPSLTPSQLGFIAKDISPIMKKASVIQCLALRHQKPSITSGLPSFVDYLKNIEVMRRNYTKFIEEIATVMSCSSSYGSDLCIKKAPMDIIHHWLTERVMQRLASLEERYRGILSKKHHCELGGIVTQDTSGMFQKRSSEHIPLDEEETFIKFFKNLVHFLFLMSCKRETMMKIMATFGCSRHRTEMKFHPHVCLFLCYIQPILFKFWKIVEVEKLLLEFFVLEYPQHACLGFLTRLKKTTKFRICLYLHMYRILGMITRMEGVKEPFRVKFLLHINILERDLVRFFKDMKKFQGLQGVKSSYALAGGLLSILEVLHYFMVQSLYKLCLLHVDKADL